MAINKLFVLFKTHLNVGYTDFNMWYDEDVSFRFKITF